MRGKNALGYCFADSGCGWWRRVIAGAKALHKTSDTAFCLSCHSMSKPFEEYQGTVHFSNQKGYVRNVPIAIFQSQGWIIYLLN